MEAAGDGSSRAGIGDAQKELAEGLLQETREELGRADSKAATLMSASGVMISVLLAGVIAGKWSPTELGSLQWLWWPGAAAGTIGVVSFAAAVWPRVSHKGPKGMLAYFGHVAQYKKVENLEAALDNKVASQPVERTVDQLHIVSKIVRRKYWLIRGGMVLLAIALLLCASSVALAAL